MNIQSGLWVGLLKALYNTKDPHLQNSTLALWHLSWISKSKLQDTTDSECERNAPSVWSQSLALADTLFHQHEEPAAEPRLRQAAGGELTLDDLPASVGQTSAKRTGSLRNIHFPTTTEGRLQLLVVSGWRCYLASTHTTHSLKSRQFECFPLKLVILSQQTSRSSVVQSLTASVLTPQMFWLMGNWSEKAQRLRGCSRDLTVNINIRCCCLCPDVPWVALGSCNGVVSQWLWL